jgi:bifunctional ADP-heptose synthase (sugar kinase/adenylyltransferase)
MPNELKWSRCSTRRYDDNVRALERAGRERCAARGCAPLITRGSRGMALFEREGPVTFMPIHGSDEIADVTGAGDTVISAFTVALAAGGSFYGVRIANYAGGLAVMKRVCDRQRRRAAECYRTRPQGAARVVVAGGPAQGGIGRGRKAKGRGQKAKERRRARKDEGRR